jgi:SAM-dependent methyltransferase
MRLLLVLLLAGGTAACRPRAVTERPTPPRLQHAVVPPSEARVRQWSHDVLDAYDRGDAGSLGGLLSESFVHFEGGPPTDRAAELASLARRKPGSPVIARRAWSHEHVVVRADHALFLGEAVEQMGGNDLHGGSEFVGWYTIAWQREGERWRVALWSWQKGGVAAERDTYNDIYRQARGFDPEPNRLLVDTVRSEKAGAALDVAMGQGRNAVYLASRGWKVTGVDFSDEGIRLARDAAAKRKVSLDAVNADLDHYDFGKDKWDLVTMLYATSNVGWIERIKPSLKPGGLFVLEYFHGAGAGGDGFASGQLRDLFADGFVVLRDEVALGTPDWSMDHAMLVRFIARKRLLARTDGARGERRRPRARHVVAIRQGRSTISSIAPQRSRQSVSRLRCCA